MGAIIIATVKNIESELYLTSSSQYNAAHFFTLSDVEAQLEQSRRQMTQMENEAAILQDPKHYLDEVAIKLDAVVNIWQTVCVLPFRYLRTQLTTPDRVQINLDMHALYTDLSLNMADDAPVTVVSRVFFSVDFQNWQADLGVVLFVKDESCKRYI